MANNYFSRLHFSIRSNVKVGMLSDKAFRFYINLLTLNGDGSLDRDPPVEWVARQCGISTAEMSTALVELNKRDLVVGNSWYIKNYEKRQYKDFSQKKRDDKKKTRKDQEILPISASQLGDVDNRGRGINKKIEEEPRSGAGVVPKKKAQKKDDGSTAMAQAMADEWNRIFQGNRGPTTTLIKAIKAVLKEEKGLTPEDFALVVKVRSTEEWVNERKLPLESLIRVNSFAGYLEKAKEMHKPRTVYSEEELADMRRMTGHGG